MTESCSNCGAELFEGQQFCRRCGTAVGRASDDAPTRLFPQGAQPAQGAAVSTSPVRGETGAVGVQQPTAYHPPANFQQTSPLVGQPFGSQPLAVGPPERKQGRSRVIWLCALLAVFVLGAGLASGAGYLWWRSTHPPVVVRRVRTGADVPPGVPVVPEVPPVPEDLGDRIKEALRGSGVPLPLDESGATVGGADTVLTRTYELDADSTFEVRAAAGSVTVTGVKDGPAVVKITKRGGSPQERSAVHVLESKTDKGLTLITAPGQGGGVSVSYEIKVPRDLRRLEISAERGDIRLSEFDGSAVLNLTNGNISVASGGPVRSRLTNGKTTIGYAGHHGEAQEFSVVNGDIEVSLGAEPEVEVKAAATNGDVKVDDALGVKAEKRGSGHRLDTRLGGGGAPLTIKVVNGDIRLKP